MKKKITACAAIGLAAVITFGGCAWKDVNKMKSPNLLSDYFTVNYEGPAVLELSGTEGMDYSNYNSGVLEFTDSEAGKTAYYFTESEVFLTFENGEHISKEYYSSAGGDMFTVLKAETDTECVYYNGLGAEIARKSAEEDNDLTVNGQLVKIGNDYYYADNSGELRLLLAQATEDMLVPDGIIGENYIYYKDDLNNVIKVYDKNSLSSKVIWYEYRLKSYAETKWFVLSDGNVLIQECYMQPDAEGDYDYVEQNGEKYKLSTYLWRIDKSDEETPKLEERDLRYRIERVINGYHANSETWGCYTFAENVAVVTSISEDRLKADTAVIVLGNDGKGKRRLDAEDKISGINDDIVSIGENRWQVSDKHGFTYIVDNECNIISRWKTDSVTRTGAFSKVGDVLYNSDMTEAVYNLKEQNAEVIASYNDCVILSKQADGGTVYYMYDGAEHEISDYVGTNELGYYTKNAEGKYCYYIGKTLLCESYGAAYFTGTGEYVLVRYTAENSGGNLFKLIKP